MNELRETVRKWQAGELTAADRLAMAAVEARRLAWVANTKALDYVHEKCDTVEPGKCDGEYDRWIKIRDDRLAYASLCERGIARIEARKREGEAGDCLVVLLAARKAAREAGR